MRVLKLVRYETPSWIFTAPIEEFAYRAERFPEHEDKLHHLIGSDGYFMESRFSQVVSLARAHGWRVEIRDEKAR
jgi:hypothetical protein